MENKQAKGGRARAKSLSKKKRSEIARKAAGARWNHPLATHEGPLSIGGMELETAVLEGGIRVVSQGKLMDTLGMYYSGYLANARSSNLDKSDTPYYLSHKSLKPFIDRHMDGISLDPLKYRTKGGQIALGVEAALLPKICDVWLDARREIKLGSRMQIIADRAEILMRGFAHVGIVALVDEATGYQYERDRKALEEYLEEFLSEELRRWVRTFPKDYFRQMCRLRGTDYRSDMRLPSYFGHLTNNVVYKRLGPRVLEQLKDKNPRDGSGRRKAKHHQWLSESVGNPTLLQHLGLVVGLMKISNDWDSFLEHLDVAAPVWTDLGMFNKIQD